VAYKTLVFNFDALTNKTMRRDLAARAYHRILLNLDKRADLRFVPNRTAVQVHQFGLKDANAGS
jgi:hypothetical protein